MSEESIWTKKTVSIIAVAWILSLVTTLVVVNFVPSLPTGTWHEVAQFHGTTTTPTDAFNIPSNQWRIRWIAQPNPLPSNEKTSFRFWAYPIDNYSYTAFELGTLVASDFEKAFFTMTSEVEYITGSGSYGIDVFVDGVEWDITIEAYY